MQVITFDFAEHLFENMLKIGIAFSGQFHHRYTRRLEDRIRIYIPKLAKEQLIEDAEIAGMDLVRILPFVGNKWIRKYDCLVLYFDYFVRKKDFPLSFYERYFVKVPTSVGNGLSSGAYKWI